MNKIFFIAWVSFSVQIGCSVLDDGLEESPEMVQYKVNVELVEWAKKGDLKQVNRLLIYLKADVNFSGFYDYSALFYAITSGHLDVVKALIEAKANVNQIVDAPDFLFKDCFEKLDLPAYWQKVFDEPDKISLLHLVCTGVNNGYHIAKILIDSGANVNAITHRYGSANGYTSLQFASHAGLFNTVRLLIDARANIKQLDGGGRSLLFFAGCPSIVKILVEAGIKVNDINHYMETPLLAASFRGYSGVVKALIDAKANINAQNKLGNSSLHCAIAQKLEPEIYAVRVLLDEGIDYNLENQHGKTALWYAQGTYCEPLLIERSKFMVSNSTDVIFYVTRITLPVCRLIANYAFGLKEIDPV